MRNEMQHRSLSATSRLTNCSIWLIGALLACSSAQIGAQVCERERQTVIATTKGQNTADIKQLTQYVHESVRDGSNCDTYCKPFRKSPNSSDYPDALRGWARANDFWAGVNREPAASQFRLFACLARHLASNISGSSGNVAVNPTRPQPPVSAPAPARVATPAPAPRVAVPLNSTVNPSSSAFVHDSAMRFLARNHVDERQAKVDIFRRADAGLPKLHESGNEAHKCLRPQPNGGVVNVCPYAVEYNYCVLNPRKGSSSEIFNCETTKGGAWQVGPNDGSIMHTDGDTTYFFACKYGETLAKPDGFSPADIEYQRGRGLLGRCAKWGSRRG